MDDTGRYNKLLVVDDTVSECIMCFYESKLQPVASLIIMEIIKRRIQSVLQTIDMVHSKPSLAEAEDSLTG